MTSWASSTSTGPLALHTIERSGRSKHKRISHDSEETRKEARCRWNGPDELCTESCA